MRGALVTGGAGFIGARLVETLLRRFPDVRVTVVDDLSSGDPERPSTFGPRVAFVRHDLGAGPLPREVLEGAFDAAFHLAACTDTRVTDEARMRRINVEGSCRLFDWAARCGVPVVYASSAAVYGITNRPCREEGPLTPANVYGRSKLEMEREARARVEGGARLMGVRYFNVYGPGEAHKGTCASMVRQLALQMRAGKRPRIFKQGEQKRDFVHVADAVEATLRVLAAPAGSLFNVGSGRARSFNEVVTVLNRALGTDLAPDYFDCPYDFFQPFTQADLSRLSAATGFAPRFDLEQGVMDALAA